MTKNELITIIAERAGVSRADVRLFLDKLNETIFQGLDHDQQVKIKGLGTFKMVSVKARKSVSVNGGETIEIPAHNKVTFTADKIFADMVNEPLAHLTVVELSESQTEIQPEVTDAPAEEGADDFVAPSRMKKLSDEAEELKGLLADINGMAAAPAPVTEKTEEPIIEEPIVEEPVSKEPVVEEPVVEKPVEKEQEREPEKTEEPVVERLSVNDNHRDDDEKGGMTHGGKMGRIFLWCMVLLLIIFGAIYWVNFRNDDKSQKEEPALEAKTEAKPETKPEATPETTPETTQETAPETVNPEQPLPDGKLSLEQMRTVKIDYSDIKGTETVREGSRLTMIALRAYGHKEFWIYLFLANRDHLSTPGQITVGSEIKIPKIDSRLVDASNPDCLQYAKELQSRYVK